MVDRSEFDLDLQSLADAKLVVAEPGNPWAMINRHVQLLKRLEQGWFVLPFTGMHAAETASERVVQNGATVEAIVGSSVADTFQSNPNYASAIEETTVTGRSDIFAHDGELPYALNCINDTLQIIAAEGDEPRALVETDSEEVREWAKGEYERYKRDSEELSCP